MTRTYALKKLLELGPLTRKEIREITGWPESMLKNIIKGCEMNNTVRNVKGVWYREKNGVLTENNL